ncbi:MAG: N-6 DNA methylase [Rhodocyclales bacterium]|nr:N-6 DNA methylase [Rhodocyclales bacterium]
MTYAQALLQLDNTDFCSAISEFEQILASNSGEDPFDSAIKLLAAKLFDETECDAGKAEKFLIHKTPEATHKATQELYRRAIRRWPYLNGSGDDLGISPQHLVSAMRPLVGWRLMGSDLSMLDAALERLVARDAKGVLGQYFTPREVVRLCVDVLAPHPDDQIIDPACGSGGFIFEAAQYALKQYGAAPNCLGIDYGARAIKVAALLSAASPKLRMVVSKANSIDGRESPSAIPKEWEGFLSKNGGAKNKRAQLWGSWNQLACSVLLTNPPFAGTIDDPEVLEAYEAQQDPSSRKAVSREHLFLERAVNLLQPGGRLAIVLPQGLLANASAAYLRKWLFGKCRVLGVVGLHPFAFLPYTSVKTSLLFLAKPGPNESLLKSYPIFFATSTNPGKDSSAKTTGTTDYQAIAQTFSRFLSSQQFSWAKTQPIAEYVSIQCETVSSSEVIHADRLDAEYYDPHARAILRRLDAVSETRLANLVDTRIDRFKKTAIGKITYLDISSVESKTGLTFPNEMQSADAPSRASYMVRPGDVLVSTVRPERNVVALVTKSVGNQAVASNGFCVLRAKEIQPEVLFAYCKTEAFKTMLSRHATASMYPTVTDKDVLGVPFLPPPQDVSDKVVNLVRSGLDMIEKAHQQITEAVALMNAHVHGEKSTEVASGVYEVRQERKPYRRTRPNG